LKLFIEQLATISSKLGPRVLDLSITVNPRALNELFDTLHYCLWIFEHPHMAIGGHCLELHIVLLINAIDRPADRSTDDCKAGHCRHRLCTVGSSEQSLSHTMCRSVCDRIVLGSFAADVTKFVLNAFHIAWHKEWLGRVACTCWIGTYIQTDHPIFKFSFG
jgi:hypothetical protein